MLVLLITMKFNNKNTDLGVSPVVGVILIVAITVILSGIITVFVFDIGGSTNQSASAGVTFSQNSDGSVTATVIDMGNADEVKLQHGGGVTTLSAVGETATISLSNANEITAVAVNDGVESVVNNFAKENPKDVGKVAFNPPVEGVTVKALDSNDNVIDTDVTDSNGQYILETGADSYEVEGYAATPDENGEINVTDIASSQGTTVANVLMDTNGVGDYKVDSASDLQAMRTDKDADYVVVSDIDASNTEDWNNGNGFEPVGKDYDNRMTGTFNGNGHEISGLYIDSSKNYVGMFGYHNGIVKNVSLTNIDIDASGGFKAGGLVATSAQGDGTIENVFVSGEIEGPAVGGIVGKYGGTLSDSHTSATVTGTQQVGGIAGEVSKGMIQNSYSTGDVTATDTASVGGVSGKTFDGDIMNSYSTGDVTGDTDGSVGGVVGSNLGDVSDSYATGAISGGSDTGGIVGSQEYNDFFSITPTVSTSYYDSDTTGVGQAVGYNNGGNVGSNVHGLTTSEMQGSSASSNMDGFDFSSVWNTVSGDYPELQWEE